MDNQVVSITGSCRKVSHTQQEIPLVYMNEVESLKLTQWYDSCSSLDMACEKALSGGAFDGVIIVCITSNNQLMFMPAR